MEFEKEWREMCINFTHDIRWLVSEISIAPHRKNAVVNKEDGYRYLVKALWDTGSTTTIICPEIAKACNLKNLGKENMLTVVGRGECNTYMVDMFLPDNIVFQNVKVVEMPCRNEHFDMVIGLDIIKLGNFSISKNEEGFVMSYNLPIEQHVKVDVDDKIKQAKAKIDNLNKELDDRKNGFISLLLEYVEKAKRFVWGAYLYSIFMIFTHYMILLTYSSTNEPISISKFWLYNIVLGSTVLVLLISVGEHYFISKLKKVLKKDLKTGMMLKLTNKMIRHLKLLRIGLLVCLVINFLCCLAFFIL